MAYSDYGAFVYCNDERRRDKENVALFATDDETFGTDSTNISSGLRIWVSLLHKKEHSWLTDIHHGIMGDGSIRVMCHKQHVPQVYELSDDGNLHKIEFEELPDFSGTSDLFDFDCRFSYKGHKFEFIAGEPCYARMLEPDGTDWECCYDYDYGAGFED